MPADLRPRRPRPRECLIAQTVDMPEPIDRRRELFDEVAELYDRARPGYPPELVTDLAVLAGLGRGNRVLEIGPGTGQLTVPLAEAGYHIVAVELGSGLAQIARRNLARYPDVEVVEAQFEDWPLPVGAFDLVVAATAWHWLDPRVRIAKSAAALRPGGTLAIVRTHDVSSGTPGFVEAAASCYRRWVSPEATFELRDPSAIPVDPELDETAVFGSVTRRTYLRDVTLASGQYVDLLATYSPNRALDEGARTGLLRCLKRLIDSQFSGRINYRFLTELQAAPVA